MIRNMMTKHSQSFLVFGVALSIAYSAVLFGCGGQEQKAEETTPKTEETSSSSSSTTATTETVAFTNANGDIVCPVSGETGKRYYFCCESCKPTFEKDSEKYKNGPPPGAKPMHGG